MDKLNSSSWLVSIQKPLLFLLRPSFLLAIAVIVALLAKQTHPPRSRGVSNHSKRSTWTYFSLGRISSSSSAIALLSSNGCISSTQRATSPSRSSSGFWTSTRALLTLVPFSRVTNSRLATFQLTFAALTSHNASKSFMPTTPVNTCHQTFVVSWKTS